MKGTSPSRKMPESFEDAMKRLEELVAQLEGGGLTLQESVEAFKEGVQLVKYCSTQLDSAEQSIRQLVKEEGGGLKLEPFLPPSGDRETEG
jgi:exodeoxyribonuclease VII small subunit